MSLQCLVPSPTRHRSRCRVLSRDPSSWRNWWGLTATTLKSRSQPRTSLWSTPTVPVLLRSTVGNSVRRELISRACRTPGARRVSVPPHSVFLLLIRPCPPRFLSGCVWPLRRVSSLKSTLRSSSYDQDSQTCRYSRCRYWAGSNPRGAQGVGCRDIQLRRDMCEDPLLSRC